LVVPENMFGSRLAHRSNFADDDALGKDAFGKIVQEFNLHADAANGAEVTTDSDFINFSTRITIQTMTSSLHRRLREPVFLLCVAAGLLAVVVQSGELGTADTMHRLQTTHWLWTSEPQVFPADYPEFGLHGRGGRLYSWYGIGQSLLMLPGDLLGTSLSHLSLFSNYTDDPAVRSIVVSYFTAILVNVLTAWIAFRLLRQLSFGIAEAVAGVLALLFCTTHLHYTQNMMENNYIMLLTLVGFSFQFEWLRSASRRALFIGSCALGLNLLTRLTTALDLMAAGAFLLLILWLEGMSGQKLVRTITGYLRIAAPVYLFFLLLDRAYQFYRFGSFTNTYVSLFALEYRQRDPGLPLNFPWTTPFHSGFLGPLLQPEKSIFLFDPLLILAFAMLILFWKRLSPAIRAFGLTSLLLLFSYIAFYARYAYWAGDFAWGDRYVSTAVELAALLAVPILVRHRNLLRETSFGKAVWIAGCALIVASLMIQLASLTFWLPLEIYQMETLGHPTFVIALRFKNILAFASGKMDAWGLTNDSMREDAWDYVHITTWNFLPFLLRRVGGAPGWVVNTALGLWLASIGALGAALLGLRNSVCAKPSSH
jgi:hypothetical protein